MICLPLHIKHKPLESPSTPFVQEGKTLTSAAPPSTFFPMARSPSHPQPLRSFMGSLFDDVLEDESNDAEDDMADFIVDEEVAVYGKGESLRQKKFKDMKHSSPLSKDTKHRSGKAGLPEEHIWSILMLGCLQLLLSCPSELLIALEPGTRYYYKYGDGSIPAMSQEHSFETFPTPI